MPELNRRIVAAFLMAVSAGFLLGGYECIRSAANTIFKAEFGADALVYAGIVGPISLIAILFLYGKVLTRYGSRRTLFWSHIFCSAFVVFGYALLAADYRSVAFPLLIFRKLYVVILIEQLWSFINSTLDQSEAKLCNGPILGVASVGAILGGYFVGQFAQTIGTDAMIFVAGLSLVPAAFGADFAFRLAKEPKPLVAQTEVLALGEMKRSPILLGLLVLIVSTQVLSTALELNFQTYLQIEYPNPDDQTAYSGNFFGHVNAIAFAMQFLLAPIILRFVRLQIIHVLIPSLHLIICIYAMLSPSVYMIGMALLIFKVTDYSVFRAAKEVLYIPLDFAARYRAKQVIDVFGYRGGEGFASALVLGLRNLMPNAGGGVYSYLVMGSALVWLAVLKPVLSKPRD